MAKSIKSKNTTSTFRFIYLIIYYIIYWILLMIPVILIIIIISYIVGVLAGWFVLQYEKIKYKNGLENVLKNKLN